MKKVISQIPITAPASAMFSELMPLLSLSISEPEGTLNLAGGDLVYSGLKSVTFFGFRQDMTLPDHCYSREQTENLQKQWLFESQCPISTGFLKDLFCDINLSRIRLQFLEPGGYLAPHCDNKEDRLSTLNISICHPEKCYFIYDHIGEVKIEPGDIYLMNTSVSHAVINYSNQFRVSLVAIGDFEDHIKTLSIGRKKPLKLS
jgi:hypothetical protein